MTSRLENFRRRAGLPLSEGKALALILVLAFVHSLIYIYLMPPWQHYDEPAHFEYAWLIANRGTLPGMGEYDQEMRRTIARSMIAHGFFRGMNFVPDLNVTDQPIWIGYSQLGDPPLYYSLAAIPISIFTSANVETQLYAARWVSLYLFLLSIVAAWGMAHELSGSGSLFRWLVPLTLALLPGYVDLMTAMNSDVGAVAIFSLFLWGAVILLRRGFSLPVCLWVAATAILCYFTKLNVALAIPLAALALALSLSARWRKWVWGVFALGVVVGFLACLQWGEAADWYRYASRGASARVANQQSAWGENSFTLTAEPGRSPQFVQLFPAAAVAALRGQEVTVGAWMWASAPTQARSPVLHVYGNSQEFYRDWEIGTTPVFHSFTASVPEWAGAIKLELLAVGDGAPGQVYFDGVVAAEGEWPADKGPVFDGPTGVTGIWDGKPFTNLVRNPSAEVSWPGIRPWADDLIARVFPDQGRMSLILYSLLDWDANGGYYRTVAGQLFRTFWARFGWGHVVLEGGKPYLVLGIVTLIGLAGAAVAFWRLRRDLPWSLAAYLALALLAIWGITFVRGAIYIFDGGGFVPAARYAYPVVIPTLLVLVGGWMEWRRLAARLRVPAWGIVLAYCIFFVGLDVLSLVSIYHFYQ